MHRLKNIFLLTLILTIGFQTYGQKLKIGVGGGLTISNATITSKDPIGKLTPGIGLNTFCSINYQIADKLSAESGLGYYFINYTLVYGDFQNKSGQAHPYIPLKIKYDLVTLNKVKIYTSIGCAFDFFAVKNITTSIDSTSQTTVIDNSLGKNNQYVNFEIGVKKTTSKNNIHQIGIGLNYGLQTVSEMEAFTLNNSNSGFRTKYNGHYISLLYTFWFGRKPL